MREDGRCLCSGGKPVTECMRGVATAQGQGRQDRVAPGCLLVLGVLESRAFPDRLARRRGRRTRGPGPDSPGRPGPGVLRLRRRARQGRRYGLAYVAALIAAVAITTKRWDRQGGGRQLVYEVALWGFPAGLIGGRLYFLATSWNQVPHHWWGPFAVWDGGLGIWGGIACGTLAGIWVLRRRGADIARFLDAAAPALLVAQAIGRVGNYFNQELFGGPTQLPWALQISPAHRPSGYEQFATFHPTFLYELLWNLLLAGALVLLGR